MPNTEWPAQDGNPQGQPGRTDEYSFLLRPDGHDGIGVFAAHPIAAGVYLRLYDETPDEPVYKTVRADTVPGEFIKYCTDDGDGWVTRPYDFGRMDMVWFLNHSADPNAGHKGDYVYYALRDIAAGEEILIDYETL